MMKMKRKISLLLALLVVVLMVGGCAEQPVSVEKAEVNEKSRFICIEQANPWLIVYDRNTKVMYTVSYHGQGSGIFTVLVNADGTPLLYDGE